MRFNEFKDHAKGKDKMPKAKLGRTKHPLKGKLVGESLTEAAKVGREYQHLEDLVFVDGSAGAQKAADIPIMFCGVRLSVFPFTKTVDRIIYSTILVLSFFCTRLILLPGLCCFYVLLLNTLFYHLHFTRHYYFFIVTKSVS